MNYTVSSCKDIYKSNLKIDDKSGYYYNILQPVDLL